MSLESLDRVRPLTCPDEQRVTVPAHTRCRPGRGTKAERPERVRATVRTPAQDAAPVDEEIVEGVYEVIERPRREYTPPVRALPAPAAKRAQKAEATIVPFTPRESAPAPKAQASKSAPARGRVVSLKSDPHARASERLAYYRRVLAESNDGHLPTADSIPDLRENPCTREQRKHYEGSAGEWREELLECARAMYREMNPGAVRRERAKRAREEYLDAREAPTVVVTPVAVETAEPKPRAKATKAPKAKKPRVPRAKDAYREVRTAEIRNLLMPIDEFDSDPYAHVNANTMEFDPCTGASYASFRGNLAWSDLTEMREESGNYSKRGRRKVLGENKRTLWGEQLAACANQLFREKYPAQWAARFGSESTDRSEFVDGLGRARKSRKAARKPKGKKKRTVRRPRAKRGKR